MIHQTSSLCKVKTGRSSAEASFYGTWSLKNCLYTLKNSAKLLVTLQDPKIYSTSIIKQLQLSRNPNHGKNTAPDSETYAHHTQLLPNTAHEPERHENFDR